jgi:hypothetical protein
MIKNEKHYEYSKECVRRFEYSIAVIEKDEIWKQKDADIGRSLSQIVPKYIVENATFPTYLNYHLTVFHQRTLAFICGLLFIFLLLQKGKCWVSFLNPTYNNLCKSTLVISNRIVLIHGFPTQDIL